MARIVKEPAVRRNEILDVAQRLVYTKGYEQMTIQDIVDDLQLSKGAFYHYFDSKQALLEALVQRLLDQMVEGFLLPLMHNAGTKRALPLLTHILCQGREEGILAVSSPEQVAEVVLVLLHGLQTALDQLLLSAVTERDILPGV